MSGSIAAITAMWVDCCRSSLSTEDAVRLLTCAFSCCRWPLFPMRLMIAARSWLWPQSSSLSVRDLGMARIWKELDGGLSALAAIAEWPAAMEHE